MTDTPYGLEPDCPMTDGGIQRSIAMSLKRIADALTNLGDHGAVINDMAYNAGCAFENGRHR